MVDDKAWIKPGFKIETPKPASRGIEVWRVQRDGVVQSCELRDDSNVGAAFEVLMREDGEILFGRRCVDEEHAQYIATRCGRTFCRRAGQQR